MTGEQPLQFPEDMTDEEIAAAVVVAAFAHHKTMIQESTTAQENRDWIDSGRPGHKPTWKHPA